MKIRSQVILAQVPIMMIILFITLFFILSLTAIKSQTESILVDNFKSILFMQKIKDSAESLNNYLLRNPKTVDNEIKNLENKIEQNLIFQEKSEMETAEEEELTKSLRKKWEVYKRSIQPLSLNKEAENLYQDLKQITTSIIGLNQDALIRKKDTLSRFLMDLRLFISFSSLVCLLLGFFMSWILTGLILSPLNKMTEIVSQFGKTDETTLLHIKGSEEIEKLSEEFNLMTNRLEEYHQSSLGHIIENYETLKGAFDALPNPLLLFDHNSNIIFMNRAASRLFGISGDIKKKNPLLYLLEEGLRDTLLKIVKKVFLSKNSHIQEIAEEQIIIFKKKKNILFIPFVYPIKNIDPASALKFTGVLILLHDPTRQTLSGREKSEIYKTFIQDFQAILTEIQMAIHTSLQETAGSLTEKQKELLLAAREKGEALERLYQDFRKVSGV